MHILEHNALFDLDLVVDVILDNLWLLLLGIFFRYRLQLLLQTLDSNGHRADLGVVEDEVVLQCAVDDVLVQLVSHGD